MPNKTWYTNIFLIINETCISIMFFTVILFAYLDKIGNNFILSIFSLLESNNLTIRWDIG